ncbi:hypothetical protein ACFY8W_10700 [Streptomyces sp. NPDC012637]|uniref:hypothetical protein n=1 Tax=Streptomyces sp. NPDC012637 TaxID=3364842 RepID=UPI0036E856C2
MRRHVWKRAGLCTALLMGLVAGPVGAAQAEVAAPAETVFQADRFVPRTVAPLGAGASGVLYRQEGTDGLLWTGWDGRTRTVDLNGAGVEGDEYSDTRRTWLPAGTDVLLYAEGGAHRRIDLATDERTTFTLPEGHIVQARVGDMVVTTTGSAGSLAYHLLKVAADGTATPVADVSGPVPSRLYEQVAADERTLVVRYPGDSDYTVDLGLFDLRTGAFTRGPRVDTAPHTQVVLTQDRLAWVTWDGKTLSSVPRDDPSATPTDVPLTPPGSARPVIAAAGQDLLLTWTASNAQLSDDPAGFPLQRIAHDGSRATTLARHAGPAMVNSADGDVVVASGADSAHWALRKTSTDGLRTTDLAAAPPVAAAVGRLSLANGVLATLESDSDPNAGVYTRTVTATPDGYRAGEPVRRDWAMGSGPWSTGDGRSLRVDSQSGQVFVETVDREDVTYFRAPSATGQVVAVTGRYAVVNGLNPDRQYVGDLSDDASSHDPIRSRAVTAASVWGTTYWTPTGTPGVLSADDLKTGAKTTLDTGAPCVPKDLQAVGRWLYWSCGPTGPAGVYDRTARKNVTVPAGDALLGDGYLVRHDRTAGQLALTAFRDGAAVTRTVGSVPASADFRRGVEWTVDRFGGPLAYVDADRRIHIVPSGVAAEPFTLVQSSVAAQQTVTAWQHWRPRWLPSRPAGTWQVALRNKRTGVLVRTLQGSGDGPTGGAVAVDWDARDERGLGVESGDYTWTMTASPADGVGAPLQQSGVVRIEGSAVTTPAGTYEPLTPTRLLDTRAGLGAPKAKVGPGQTVSLKVAGVGGVPASGVTAVVLNVTATGPTAAGFVSAYPSGAERTSASNLNFVAGQTVANAVVVPVLDGKVTFYNRAGSVDLLADVSGYFTEGDSGSTYRPVTPDRILDTRSGLGAPKAKVGAGRTVTVQVAGRAGVPQSGATAVVLNVTATNPTATSFVSVYPSGTQRTSASSLNVTAGRTVPNLVTVPLVDGKVNLYNHNGSVDLLADVAGYYTEDPAADGSRFTAVGPVRVMDTRVDLPLGTGYSGMSPASTKSLGFLGAHQVPASGVRAVVLNVTATAPTAPSFVSVYPYGTTRTAASNLNFVAGQTVPNLVVVPVVNGSVTFYNHNGDVHLIADLVGYYR